MKNVTGLLVVLLSCLMGRASGIEPNSGYCIGNQCYTVFQDPSDYSTAEDQCSAQGGQLMTVRSSVSHDILFILLGNMSGRFWIGLHLPTGCPDATAELKGFQWVTKDSESDFFNWAPNFDSSCSSPHRCVSVSPEDEFKWTQEPCSEHRAGFLCEYSFKEPCTSLAAAEGETVTYKTPMGFEGEDVLSLPPGSIAIRTPAETTYVCFSEQWLQAPWSCEIHNGGCESKCAVSPNQVPSCYCPPGQTVNPANKVTCEKATEVEDPCVHLRCDHACFKNEGSYACMCDHGFKLAPDGRSCVDFNDCKDERQCPGENFRCVNTVGGFECVCKDGFQMSGGGQCVDENECESAPCEHECTNSPGSYECSCYAGYKQDPESRNKCKLHCGKEECPAKCDPNDMFECYCPDGYIAEERGDLTVCIDIDECLFLYCDQDCQNKFGDFVCKCSRGYTLIGKSRCVKNEDTDSEGSGWTPDTPTRDPPTAPPVTYPGPTRKPSALTVGGLVGVIVCTAFFIVLLVCLAHHFLCSRGKTEDKSPEPETHGLNQVASDP